MTTRATVTVILVIHQAIHVPTMRHNLITPMQLRMNDVRALLERDNPLPTAASNLSDEFILDNLNSINPS